MKAPPGVVFHSEERLMVWQPHGLVDEKTVNEIIRFIGPLEGVSSGPFDRFTDLTEIDGVDLNFDYVFHIALYRRMRYAGCPPVKSAFLVKSRESTHYAKLHAMLTDHSPLQVRVFTEREAAARWLGVAVHLLMPSAPAIC
jgi:hypothetical protein